MNNHNNATMQLARRHAMLCGFLCLLGALGCSSGEQTSATATASAAPVSVDECDACGMVVREQPAPRGQLLHRDNTRRFFCSLSDMLHYMRAPSSHGAIEHVFVEVLDPAADPIVTSTEARPWVAAKSASYVVGVQRPNVMGAPLLAYENEQQAEAMASRHAGQVKTWQELKKFPLSQ
jgi:copper chaperone NosL